MERFWNKVNKGLDTGCWVWTGAKFPSGYGCFRVCSANKRAHRFSYELTFGPIPKKMLVCHICDNRLCVRPSHLFIGSQKDNIQDMMKKGRGSHIGRFGEQHNQRKLSNAQVMCIRSRYKSGHVSTYGLAKEFNISQGTISDIILRKTWKHLG